MCIVVVYRCCVLLLCISLYSGCRAPPVASPGIAAQTVTDWRAVKCLTRGCRKCEEFARGLRDVIELGHIAIKEVLFVV